MDWLWPYGDECGGSVLVMGTFVPHGGIRFVGGGMKMPSSTSVIYDIGDTTGQRALFFYRVTSLSAFSDAKRVADAYKLKTGQLKILLHDLIHFSFAIDLKLMV